MLLKKTLNRFVLKKNPKKNDKPANALPLGRKGRLGFSVYAAAVLCFCCFSIPAFVAFKSHCIFRSLKEAYVVTRPENFDIIRHSGLIPAATLEEAWEKAQKNLPENYKVTIMGHAAATFPVRK